MIFLCKCRALLSSDTAPLFFLLKLRAQNRKFLLYFLNYQWKTLLERGLLLLTALNSESYTPPSLLLLFFSLFITAVYSLALLYSLSHRKNKETKTLSPCTCCIMTSRIQLTATSSLLFSHLHCSFLIRSNHLNTCICGLLHSLLSAYSHFMLYTIPQHITLSFSFKCSLPASTLHLRLLSLLRPLS